MPAFWRPPMPKDAVILAPLLLLFPSAVFCSDEADVFPYLPFNGNSK